MNNLIKKTNNDLSSLQDREMLTNSNKNKNSLHNELRLQIRNFLFCSVIFTIFVLACSNSVVSNVRDPNLVARLQDRFSAYHIIALHIMSFGTFVATTILDKED